MNDIIFQIKEKTKNCRECFRFIASRVLFILAFGIVLGTISNQHIATYPATKLLNEVKASAAGPILTINHQQTKE